MKNKDVSLGTGRSSARFDVSLRFLRILIEESFNGGGVTRRAPLTGPGGGVSLDSVSYLPESQQQFPPFPYFLNTF